MQLVGGRTSKYLASDNYHHGFIYLASDNYHDSFIHNNDRTGVQFR